jgi:hypothetical protein
VWVRGAAIRPVPPYAIVDEASLAAVQAELARGSAEAQQDLDRAFQRFERTQPALADRMSTLLARPLDETALALGYFLTIAVWLAFERAFGDRLGEVSAEAALAAEEGLRLEAEIRASRGDEPFEVDDVVARQQPSILAFVHEHVDTALDVASRPDDPEIDVDHVDMVYRGVVALTLALSHAVVPLPGTGGGRPGEGELMA